MKSIDETISDIEETILPELKSLIDNGDGVSDEHNNYVLTYFFYRVELSRLKREAHNRKLREAIIYSFVGSYNFED